MTTREFLKEKVKLFKDFSDDRLQQLVNGLRVASFETNEAVAHCGEEATHFSVVLSGAVSASMIGEGGTRQVLGRLEAGGTFGELALMTGDKLPADFIAESPSQVLRIPVSLFQSIIMAEPKAVQQV
jgi:acetate kinase